MILSLVLSVGMATKIDGIAATIDSSAVTLSDLSAFQSRKDGGFVDEILLFGASEASLKTDRMQALDYLINDKIMELEIKRLNLTVTYDRVDQEIREIARQNNMSKADLLKAVKAQGLSAAEYQDFTKQRIERKSLLEIEISAKIRVSDEEVLAEFAKKTSGTPAQINNYSLAHIFFNVKKDGEAKAMDRAREVYARLKSGADFKLVAEQTTQDPNFQEGAKLGDFKDGELLPEFDSTVRQMAEGSFSEPIRSKRGIHILKLTSKTTVIDPRYEKQKEEIRAALSDQHFRRLLKTWFDSKREDYFVSTKLEAPKS